MFNANTYGRKAEKQVPLASMTGRDFLTALVEGGKVLTGKKFVTSTRLNKDYLLLGTFDDAGNAIEGTDFYSIHVSAKLKLKGITDDQRFAELIENYPIFYGENPVVEGGIPTGEVRTFLTFAPAGDMVSRPASKLDIAAIISGKSITTAAAV